MKVRLGDLRGIVREEYLRGIPEYVLNDLTKRYVDQVRAMLARHIESTCRDPIQTREKIAAANDVLKDLEVAVNQALEDKLWSFMQRT